MHVLNVAELASPEPARPLDRPRRAASCWHARRRARARECAVGASVTVTNDGTSLNFTRDRPLQFNALYQDG